MRALSIAIALLLAYARGFTLDARGWPSTDDAVAEARYATNTYRARNGSLEFVHVHKCAGTTVNLHVSALLCAGRPDDVATPGDHRAVGEACANVQTPVADRETVAAWRRTPCRLVRPHPVDARRSLALIAETYGAAPRFVSAHEEWSAFEIAWRPETTYKAVVVRSPYAWWKSNLLYACRCKDRPPAYGRLWTMAQALRTRDAERASQALRNRVAQTALPRALVEELERGAAGAPAATRRVLASYAFVGTVERLDASLCLLARTFLSGPGACALCCARSAGATPHHNAGADDACAAAANFSAGDEAAFVARHAADAAVYDAAAAVLGARLAAAAREDWGGVGASCACDVVVE